MTLQTILEAATPLIVIIAIVIVSIYLIPWLKVKIGEDKYQQIEAAAKMAVFAAEQLGLEAETAKAYAIDLAQEMLDDRGIEVDVAILANLIEAVLWREINRYKAADSSAAAMQQMLTEKEFLRELNLNLQLQKNINTEHEAEAKKA